MHEYTEYEKFHIEVDQVNHPRHYTSDASGVECIEITRHRNFNIGNAFKYLWRAGIKDDLRHGGFGGDGFVSVGCGGQCEKGGDGEGSHGEVRSEK